MVSLCCCHVVVLSLRGDEGWPLCATVAQSSSDVLTYGIKQIIHYFVVDFLRKQPNCLLTSNSCFRVGIDSRYRVGLGWQ